MHCSMEVCRGFLNGNTPCIVPWKYAVGFSMEIGSARPPGHKVRSDQKYAESTDLDF